MSKIVRLIFELFAFFMFPCFHASAKVVPLDRATTMAETFWNQHKYSKRGANASVLFAWDNRALKVEKRSSPGQEALFYVFEGSGGGFVIVSADDAVMPILGYSFSEKLPPLDNIPDPMQGWIAGIEEQIQYVRDHHVENASSTEKWAKTPAGDVVISMETALWDQREPYNIQCPLDGDELSVTGCTAVAAAIIMRYYKWPASGIGTTEGYNTDTKGIWVEPRDLNHSYNWEKMPMSYDKFSQEEAQAVSTLMADLGCAFKADYTKDGTAATIDIKAMFEHFGFDPSMHYVFKENFSNDYWLQMIKDELLLHRPVAYAGFGDMGGHQFVLDGFTSDNYFHVNWGWSGHGNGYYTLSSLSPDLSPDTYSFSFNQGQEAILNMIPKASSEVIDWIKFCPPGLVISETDIKQNVSFLIDKMHFFMNYSVLDFSGVFRGALTDKNGTIKEWITQELEYTLESGHGIGWSNVSATITVPIDFGDRIRFFYKSNTSDEWHLVKTNNEIGCSWEVLVADEYSIAESTSFSYDSKNNIITLTTKDGVQANLLSSDNEDVTDILSHEGNTIIIDTKKLTNNVYVLRLQKGSEVKLLELALKSIYESL